MALPGGGVTIAVRDARRKEQEMKVLVTAASKHGATHEIAVALGRAIREEGVEVDVVHAEDGPAVGGYGAVVLGSAAYFGKWLDEAVRFVDAHETALRALPVWLFSSGPLGWPLKPAAADAVHVEEIIARLEPREHRLLAGELDRHKLGVMERSIVRAVHAPEGDFRNWDEIEAWGRDIAGALKGSGAGPAGGDEPDAGATGAVP